MVLELIPFPLILQDGLANFFICSPSSLIPWLSGFVSIEVIACEEIEVDPATVLASQPCVIVASY